MKTDLLPVPGILWGDYPERVRELPSSGARIIARFRASWLFPAFPTQHRRFTGYLRAVTAHTSSLDEAGFAEHLQGVRAKMGRAGLTEKLVGDCFALFGWACARELGIRPFDTQMIAASIMLDNRLAEMATGEGKSLAIALAAATAALAGVPVHVITANDYLVDRDCETMRPVYAALGLSAGKVTQSLEAAQRRKAYGCDICYCTAKELVFDYLRDGLVLGDKGTELQRRAARLEPAGSAKPPTLLRGLCMGIIDEADSILIDEARVPLVISRPESNPGEQGYYAHALRMAAGLVGNVDYRIDREAGTVEVTAQGEEILARSAACGEATWLNRRHRTETICQALAALHLFQRDRHYLVRDGQIYIIDETTGRLAQGRTWSRGLHQLIELKEGCRPSGQYATEAQITYQRFFPRYLRLAGMSGTLTEARAELLTVYGLKVRRVARNKPCRRLSLPLRLYADSRACREAVASRVSKLHEQGRPVLIGTNSVEESEMLSGVLSAANLPHAVLNARQDAAEAEIVARAGGHGRITVATNMAGRGTDIALEPGVAERGGLHVILCQHNASRRIDRQFLGRCGRRGEPGSSEIMLALDAPLISGFWPTWLIRRLQRRAFVQPAWLARLLIAIPQRLEERRHNQQRLALMLHDDLMSRWLPSGGRRV